MKLFPHQQYVINHLLLSKQRGLLIYHEIGSGKTLIALEYCNKFPNKIIKCIMPMVLFDNLLLEFAKFYPGKSNKRFIKVTNVTNLEDSIILIDECHLLCNEIVKKVPGAIELYDKIMRTKDATILALSATPAFEFIFEFSPLYNMLSGKEIFSRNSADFNNTYTRNSPTVPRLIDQFQQYIHPMTSHFAGLSGDPRYFATVLMPEKITVRLNSKQFEMYKNKYANEEALQKNDNYIGNESPKITKLMSFLSDEIKEKGLIAIYSDYSEFINILVKALHDKKLKYAYVDKNNYNKYAPIINSDKNINGDIIKIIIYSSDLTFGVSFSNVRFCHIMNVKRVYNEYLQIIGRCFRLYSHKNLPIELRKIQCYIWSSIIDENYESMEEHIADISSYFKDYIISFVEFVKEASIENPVSMFVEKNKSDS